MSKEAFAAKQERLIGFCYANPFKGLAGASACSYPWGWTARGGSESKTILPYHFFCLIGYDNKKGQVSFFLSIDHFIGGRLRDVFTVVKFWQSVEQNRG